MSSTLAYRRDIDGLRAVAVGAVVAYHAFPSLLPGGFVGVDIFFVISGFLITGILVREYERDGRIDLAEFYARRVRRLLPAFLFVLAGTLALGLWLIPASGELQSLGRSALAALFFASNIYFALQPSGYFAEAAETDPLLHTWTLAVEEQFYIVWPLLIPLAAGVAARVGRTRREALWTLFAAMFVSSLAISLIGTSIRPTWAFYLTPFRAWEFAIGAMLSIAMRGDAPRFHHGATALSVFGLLLIALSLWLFDHATSFPGWIALLPTCGAAALLAAGAIAPRNPIARLLALRPIVYVGRLSYGWYLWHWPLLAFVRSDALGEPSTAILIAAVIVSFLLSVLSFRVVESPIRHQRLAVFRATRPSLVAGVVMLFGGAAAAIAVMSFADYRLGGSRQLQAIAIAAGAAEVAPGFPGPCNNYVAKFTSLTAAETCMLGDRTATPIVVLLGDSHALHLVPMLDLWGRRNHIAVLPRTRGGCRPLSGDAGVIGIPPTPANLTDCRKFTDAVFAEAASFARTGRVIAVVVGSRWPDAGLSASAPGDSSRVFAGRDIGLRRLADLAHASGFRLVLTRDTPSFPHNVPACLARRSTKECGVARRDADAHRNDASATIARIAASNRGVRVFDPSTAICDDRFCYPDRGGVVLFKDDHHLSIAGSTALTAALAPALDAAILGK